MDNMNKRDLLTKIIVGLMIQKGYLDIRSMHNNAKKSAEEERSAAV
jgi:hypothetical protein